jgi:hypothetical protein
MRKIYRRKGILDTSNGLRSGHVINNNINSVWRDKKPVRGVKNRLSTKIPNFELNSRIFLRGKNR